MTGDDLVAYQQEIEDAEAGRAAKSPAHTTFGGTDASKARAVVIHLSNSEPMGLAHIDAAGRKTELASGTSFAGLKAHAEAGQELIEAKKHLGHGSFDREATARLGITKQWRSRLMRVGKFWTEVQAALAWAKTENRLTKTEYSVDGALRLLKQYQCARDGNSETAEQPVC